jgi:hypothetical protein
MHVGYGNIGSIAQGIMNMILWGKEMMYLVALGKHVKFFLEGNHIGVIRKHVRTTFNQCKSKYI